MGLVMHHDFFQILFRFSLCCCDDVGDGVCGGVCVVFSWQLAQPISLVQLLPLSLVSAYALALKSQLGEEALPLLDIARLQIRHYNHLHYNRRHHYCNRHNLIGCVDCDGL